MEVKVSIGKGIDVLSDGDTFGEWAAVWLKLKETQVVYRRFYECRLILNKYYSHMMDIQISKIKTKDIQNIIIENSHLGYGYLKIIKSIAKQVFQLAIENRVIEYNPAVHVKIQNMDDKKERRALTKEEQQWIIETEHTMQPAAMIMMYAGLRRGEVSALTWNDINLEEMTIEVNKIVVKGKEKTCEIKSGAKTKAGVRKVYIPNILADYLKSLHHHESGFVITSPTGKIISTVNWDILWRSYMKTLNLKYGEFPKNAKK